VYFILYFQNTFFKYFVIFKILFLKILSAKAKLISDRDPQLLMSLSCRSAALEVRMTEIRSFAASKQAS